MSATDHLPIDLADPDDIRAKLPQARELFAAKQRELLKLSQQVEYWGSLVNLLARLVGEPGVTRVTVSTDRTPERIPDRKKRAPSQERAMDALRRYGRPAGPRALFRFMVAEQLDAPANANALGASLYGAEKAGRIRKTPAGLYAPPDWEPEQDTLTTENGAGQPPSMAVPNQEAASE